MAEMDNRNYKWRKNSEELIYTTLIEENIPEIKRFPL